jgi:ectoine hydroxylase-related dioxygenase (phytanoyl-CoA dioxygenase family)
MELTADQVEQLFHDGWVRLPAAVASSEREAALRAINESLGRGIDPREVETYRARSFCPELQPQPVITDLLYRSGAWRAAESLLGEGRIEQVTRGQIALAFPTRSVAGGLHPHLDGMYTPNNGVPPGQVLSFSMLAGVLLSDVPAASSGSLIVWPGTHRLYETYFRDRGPQCLLDGMPPVPLPEPVPITGQAGDVVLCHYQLGHTAGPNTSPHVRYAVYFRLKHVDHARQRWECLTDIWREWPGVREVVAAGAAAEGTARTRG